MFRPQWMTIAGGSGNLNTLVAGSTTGGTAVSTAGLEKGTLSCQVDLLAETNTITLTPVWQVSDDKSTWYDLKASTGAAQVAQCTGTAGADTVTSAVLACPQEAIGWKFVRAAVRNAVATGATGDTYVFTYKSRKFMGFAN